MIPGLIGLLALSVDLLEPYRTLRKPLSQSSFNIEELTVVWQTINVEHKCHYCVPYHIGNANMMKVDPLLTE
ncbi:MAG: hypothetical protein ACI9FW_001337 [Flavobacterium sp.]|jgi:hypothetical protein